MTFVTAPGSEVLLDHEQLKLSRSAIEFSGPVLRDFSFKAIITLQVRYSKTFDSSYDMSLQEAGTTSGTRQLAFVGSCKLPFGEIIVAMSALKT